MRVKTTIQDHFTLIELAINLKSDSPRCWQEYGLMNSHKQLMELKIGMPFEKNLAISNKIKNKQTFSSQQFHSQAYAPEKLLLGGGGGLATETCMQCSLYCYL